MTTAARRTVTPSSQLVLIVEDDEHTRQMYAEWLNFSGFRVAEARSADEALEKARELRPDAITMDLALPGSVDGCQLTARLKAYARTETIPIIAVTGWAIREEVERARRAGCDSVLIKPCLPETLLAEIHRILKTPSARSKQRR
ncbi:MAG TPA: response regulator [Vicinamibacterales bacterium]|nr:response regulator [Vicinamibacterales bacterium]